MENFSYITAVIATVLGLCEPFGKKMKTILTLNFLGNLLVGANYHLKSGISGAAICYVACFQVLINYIFDSKGKKVPMWLIIIHAVVFVTLNILTFRVWYDILALIAAMLFVLSVAQNSSKHYRLLYFTNSAVWIFYDILSGVYENLATHAVLTVATFVAIILRDKKIKKHNCITEGKI
ncbi:MAG: YgjV family protein [Clostridia bacterium]|nr:YgjV family protein [Clostridia bacterium]